MVTLDHLSDIRRKVSEAEEQRNHRIHVCVAAGCIAAGSRKLLRAFQEEITSRGLNDSCLVKGVGCIGPCAGSPAVAIEPEGIVYCSVKPEDVPEIMDSLAKQPVARLQMSRDLPFFTRQKKIVLENSGRIDPEQIDDYIAAKGYHALYKVISTMSPAEVISEVIKSGLRGRGGAGYPTGLKWTTVAKTGQQQKYVVCNADEGDPGAFMDRSVLESDPHRVLEGMAIAGYAVGANKGYIYIRAEYPLAYERLRKAIKQAEEYTFLGQSIMGTTYGFHVELRLGAGAYVCGEETALIASIEGGRGTPRPRPPYPAERGLFGKSTLINNVETYANISSIIRNGGDWFASIGTQNSKGTKVFALAGNVKNVGLIEVPMGETLREIIYEIGGGMEGQNKLKAVQTGGPTGGCIPESELDTPVDYESLASLGSIMGSGGMVVIDDSVSIVDIARYFMEFSVSESCGKCVPCRVGTTQMHELHAKINRGEGTKRDLELLEELCEVVKHTSLCGLGQSAPNPVLSTLRFFRSEYEAQLTDHEVLAAEGVAK
ncbi:MAG: NAD(P)H-dependent oxidoreductase subunit E [Calditrichaeota bacterium]|nr:NAD(P)H-dependent oxidoreductase subunit E [Calditrichota bacterium]MCB9367330.1 NAD(P)H-dependent oxidoreductase subunit E [Calditrichota bacterium]